MIGRLLRAAARLGVDPDLRAYAGFVVRNPGALRISHPAVYGTRPGYLSEDGAPDLTARRTPGRALLSWGDSPLLPDSFELELAGARQRVDRGRAPDWHRCFGHEEQTSALHRFAWLLPIAVDLSERRCPAAAVLEFLDRSAADWSARCGVPDGGEAWHPYAVSERCVNWMLTSLACGRPPAVAPWEPSLRAQAEHLFRHLEYHGERLTGNHLSNNGRALYLTGLALREESWRQAGLQILLQESRRLFVEPRFLREGSSHYQFLVTRNYCEALWFALEWGDPAAERLRAIVAPLVDGCRFFLVPDGDGGWEFPLIGDISPDCPPGWLTGVPWVGAELCGIPPPPGDAPRSGWHSLFPRPDAPRGVSEPADRDLGREWVRHKKGRWTVFAHLNPEGSPFRPGHAHQDTGAIAAYLDGRPVIVDAGRFHYSDDRVGRWGGSARAHSMLIVGGADPAPEWRWFLAPEFLERRIGERPSFISSIDGFGVRHGGYARIGAGVVERAASIEGDVLRVHDRVGGSGRHRIELVLHLAGELSIRAGRRGLRGAGWSAFLELPPDLTEVEVSRGPRGGLMGWRSMRYGERTPVTTVVASGRVSLPWDGVTAIRGGS